MTHKINAPERKANTLAKPLARVGRNASVNHSTKLPRARDENSAAQITPNQDGESANSTVSTADRTTDFTALSLRPPTVDPPRDAWMNVIGMFDGDETATRIFE